jgi:hypothetical protein
MSPLATVDRNQCAANRSIRRFGFRNRGEEAKMYASIRRYQIDAASVTALKVRVEDGFIPIVSKLPGFVSYMIVDAGDGVVASISIFESEEAAEQSNAAAAKWVKESLADVVAQAPDITAGEIVLAAPTPAAW